MSLKKENRLIAYTHAQAVQTTGSTPDSWSLASLVKRKIETGLDIKVRWAQSFAEVRRIISEEKEDFCLGILDLTLPDAGHGEVVDYVLAKGIPGIVFAGTIDGELRAAIWSKMIVDYVLKDNPHNIDYLVGLIRRIFRNRFIKALVVDDSEASRIDLSNLLTIHKYDVYYAASGEETLAVLAEHPDIKLAIIDYYMPGMDGIELIKQIRQTHSKEELAILGLSARDEVDLPTRFLKNGANDFIKKPFVNEEFYCRITQNIEIVEYIEAIKSTSNTDYLTGLYNRRYFFELGRKLYASGQRGHITLTLAMIDIDLFKRVNDTHGHDAGDVVLKEIATILGNRFRASDVVCRYGGEEFCVLATNMAVEHARRVFDELRQKIASSVVFLDGATVRVTVSIGLCQDLLDSFEEMIKVADDRLYAAKAAGRNRVEDGSGA